MNLEKLKVAEQRFFELHPQGFDDPSMQQIAKRHRMDKMVEFAHSSFAPDCYSHVEQTAANMVKAVSRGRWAGCMRCC